jgi:hypothetical protein
VLTQTVASNTIVTTQGGLPTYSIDPVTFTNLAGTGNYWYLTVEIYGTGWGTSDPYATVSVETNFGTIIVNQYCNPGDACKADRTYSGAAPTKCVTNYVLLQSELMESKGGSVTVNVKTTNVGATKCNYQGSSIYIAYTLSGTNPQPTAKPSPQPTLAPVPAGGFAPPTLDPTAQPTAPTAAPSPLPTVAPSAAPSPFPTYSATATISRISSSSEYDAGKNCFPLEPLVLTNLYAASDMVWLLTRAVD